MPQVTFRGFVDQRKGCCLMPDSFFLADRLEISHHVLFRHRREAKYRASTLNRLDDVGAVVCGKDEPRGSRALFHDSPHRGLGVTRHRVAFIQKYNPERNLFPSVGVTREVLYSHANSVDSTLVRRVKLQDVVLPIFLQDLSCKAECNSGLSRPWRSCKQKVWHLIRPRGNRFKPAYDLSLVHYF